MIISLRVALQGVGLLPLSMATQGFIYEAVPVTAPTVTIVSSLGGGGPGRKHERLQLKKLELPSQEITAPKSLKPEDRPTTPKIKYFDFDPFAPKKRSRDARVKEELDIVTFIAAYLDKYNELLE